MDVGPDRQRVAVSLKYLQDWESSEAASFLGLSTPVFEQLLFRARKRFARTVAARLTFGWIMGALVSAIGILLSFQWDLPTGATIVCTFGVVLAALRTISMPLMSSWPLPQYSEQIIGKLPSVVAVKSIVCQPVAPSGMTSARAAVWV